ncbi:iron uptake porin [Candidatus Cyanaurora vandensis]|uniref:iron uptake porin n=1 Tax=Candidatus Cyanaurora vandensis TaxID=2714958 RepID=UPI002580A6D5|nr:iron uptake porin [Candidatus Cyanaurora vandensis]
MNKLSVLKGLAGALSLSLLAGLAPVQAQNADSAMIDQYAQGLGSSNISQVTSISELSDVDPNSWAFQALKSLVERYGCIEGYPSKVFLGNKATTRYEFAAGLNACLDRVNELIAAATADKVTRDDLATLQRLQEEFAAELATLRGRVDALEAKVKELESQQFSTTTKLDGSVVMAVQGSGANSGSTYFAPSPGVGATPFTGFGAAFGDRFGVETPVLGSAANTSFVARTSLNLRTSFTGQDELLIRLRGVSGQDAGNVFRGVSSGLGTLFYAAGPFGGAYDDSATAAPATNGIASVNFDKIRYTTPIFGESFRIFAGPRIDLFEFFDTNSFANNEEVDFSSGFHINNPLTTFIFAGPGGGFDWELSPAFSLRGVYIAKQGGGAFSGNAGGLTGSGTIAAGETEFRAGTAKLKLQYSTFSETVPNGGIPAGLGGGTVLGNNMFGNITSSTTIAGGVNAEWAVTPSLGIFGRYGFARSYVLQPSNSAVQYFPGGSTDGISSTTWQAGLSVGNLIVPDSVLGVAVGQPIRISGGQVFVNTASAGFPTGLTGLSPSGTEFNIEAFYKFPLNDRITITPDVQIITQPGNISTNPTITVGTLRAVFTF